jgi:hypothetical protein
MAGRNHRAGCSCAPCNPESPLDRFWRRVSVGDDCWLWTGDKNLKGYGIHYWGQRNRMLAHRFSYELAKGPIPEGLLVCHSCDVPNCVNPDHLWVGTTQDNARDAAAKGKMGSAFRNRTACIRGHEYTPENTRWDGTVRRCRKCSALRSSVCAKRKRQAMRAGT